MSDGKHTPGPWRVDAENFSIVGHPDWPCRRFGVDGEWSVARVEWLAPDAPNYDAAGEESKANARLIAAAPDLLAAAKAQDELMRTPGDPTENIQRVIRMRRAAIAKAEGGAEPERNPDVGHPDDEAERDSLADAWRFQDEMEPDMTSLPLSAEKIDELRDCPFCGLAMEASGEMVRGWRHPARSLEEARCPASGTFIEAGDEQAAERWNRRSPPVVHAAEPVAWRWRRRGSTEWASWTWTKVHPEWLKEPEFEIMPLFASPQGDGHSVAIKPLEWKECDGGYLSRGGLFEYWVKQPINANVWRWAKWPLGAYSDPCSTAAEAMAAAEAHYQERILSALLPQGVPASPLSGVTEEQVEGWQPIETAPKDRTMVDLWGSRNGKPRRFTEAQWCEIHMMGTGDPTGEYRWFFPAWDMYGEFAFTHWRPLPNPPALAHPGKGGEKNG